MENENYIMATSMLQYLEEVDNYLTKNGAVKTEGDLIPGDDNPGYMKLEDSVQFDFEKGRELVPIDQIDDAQGFPLENFDQKLSLDEEMGEGEQREEDEEIKSDSPDQISVPNSKTDFKTPSTVSKEEESGKKQKLSNKERARRARQRKKKYYEDLERRAEHLENKVTRMSKEIEYLKHKLRFYENCNTKICNKTASNMEICFFDKVEKLLKESDDCEKVSKAISEAGKNFGPFGKEKIKLLENNFDMFLENILSGSPCKIIFYAVDKEIPQTHAEFQSFLKMKKYQIYEKYPDETLREFIGAKAKCLDSKEEFNNFVKNAIPIFKNIKQEMKQGIANMIQGKNQIYQALMKYDLHYSQNSHIFWKKLSLQGILEEMKHSSFKLSYKDAFDVKESCQTINVELPIPNPNAFKKLRMKILNMSPDDDHPSKLEREYCFRNLEVSV